MVSGPGASHRHRGGVSEQIALGRCGRPQTAMSAIDACEDGRVRIGDIDGGPGASSEGAEGIVTRMGRDAGCMAGGSVAPLRHRARRPESLAGRAAQTKLR